MTLLSVPWCLMCADVLGFLIAAFLRAVAEAEGAGVGFDLVSAASFDVRMLLDREFSRERDMIPAVVVALLRSEASRRDLADQSLLVVLSRAQEQEREVESLRQRLALLVPSSPGPSSPAPFSPPPSSMGPAASSTVEEMTLFWELDGSPAPTPSVVAEETPAASVASSVRARRADVRTEDVEDF